MSFTVVKRENNLLYKDDITAGLWNLNSEKTDEVNIENKRDVILDNDVRQSLDSEREKRKERKKWSEMRQGRLCSVAKLQYKMESNLLKKKQL